MRVGGFEWNDGNRAHIGRHQVDEEEVEEAFSGKHYLFKTKDGRYILLGKSGTGRFLFIVFECRSNRVVHPITARDMTDSERRLYRQKT